MESSRSDAPGQTPTEYLGFREILHFAWRSEFTTKSDFARLHANMIAAAASQGWLTTYDPVLNAFSNSWRITPSGLQELFE